MEPRVVWVYPKLLLLRQDHLMVELIAAWEPQSPDDEQHYIQWAQNISQHLHPMLLGRVHQSSG